MKTRWMLHATVLGLTIVLVLAVAAPAGATGAGFPRGFCEVTLPVWPAAAPTTAPPCADGDGDANDFPSDGTLFLVGGGVDDFGVPYTVNGPGTFEATLTYSDACIGGEPSPVGFMSGSENATGIPATYGGVPTTASHASHYEAVRLGATMVVLVDDNTLGAPDVEFATGGYDNGDLNAAIIGAVVPKAPIPPPTCAAPGPLELSILSVAGGAVLVG